MSAKAENKHQQNSFESVFHTVAALSRPDANRWLSDNLEKLSGDLWLKYRGARERELLHINHVRRVMAQLQLGKGVEATNTSKHDFSKDEWYFLVTIAKFTLGFPDLVDSAFKEAVNEHYALEPHHPEHEKVAGKECTAYDIVEMAVDRLSRNLQFNNGTYNREQMEKFAPVFPVARDWKLGDVLGGSGATRGAEQEHLAGDGQQMNRTMTLETMNWAESAVKYRTPQLFFNVHSK